jgi:heme-degrading monooxygenase HmoA
MTFRSLIRFEVKPGAESEFESAFDQAGMLVRPKQIEGFIDAELFRSVGEPVEYIVIGSWETEQAYAQWQAVSRDEADSKALSVLSKVVIDPQPGKLFSPVSSSKATRKP